MRLLMFGPPGAGKGTQAKLLSDRYRIPHISSGDLLRAAVENNTELGRKAKTFMDAGALVPDDVIIAMIVEVINSGQAEHGFILDGFPRTVPQAEALSATLQRLHMELDRVISLEVDTERILARFTSRRTCRACKRVYNVLVQPELEGKSCPACGGELYLRDDDNEATVRNRMTVYLQKTQPLKDYYKAKGILSEIDGMQEIQVIFQAIAAQLPHVK